MFCGIYMEQQSPERIGLKGDTVERKGKTRNGATSDTEWSRTHRTEYRLKQTGTRLVCYFENNTRKAAKKSKRLRKIPEYQRFEAIQLSSQVGGKFHLVGTGTAQVQASL